MDKKAPERHSEDMVDVEHGEDVHRVSFREYMMHEIDPSCATFPLAAFCFMTGFMYDLSSLSLLFPFPLLQRRLILLRHFRMVWFPNWQFRSSKSSPS